MYFRYPVICREVIVLPLLQVICLTEPTASRQVILLGTIRHFVGTIRHFEFNKQIIKLMFLSVVITPDRENQCYLMRSIWRHLIVFIFKFLNLFYITG